MHTVSKIICSLLASNRDEINVDLIRVFIGVGRAPLQSAVNGGEVVTESLAH